MSAPDRISAIDLWTKALDSIEKADPKALQWARSIDESRFRSISATQFLREYCYVVYASGFKANTIQLVFPDLRRAFCNFDLEALAKMRSLSKPLAVFGNERKAQSFLSGAKAIAKEGWAPFKKRLACGNVEMLMELPGIGPITKDHLAKNIGLADVVKSDVWLERAAVLCGKSNPNALVDEIRGFVDESRHTIDVVIWHFGKEFNFNKDRKFYE